MGGKPPEEKELALAVANIPLRKAKTSVIDSESTSSKASVIDMGDDDLFAMDFDLPDRSFTLMDK